MKLKTALLNFVLVFMLSAMVVTAASAQERTVGVAEGDWFTYDITASWNSTDPDAVCPPPDYSEWDRMNRTEWVKITILEITGTNVSLECLSHFKNGTEDIGAGYIDVDTGDNLNAAVTLVAANLDTNDTIYTSGEVSAFMINETITRTYSDAIRNTTHINITQGSSWTENETEYHYYTYMNMYWDKETGMFVEQSVSASNKTGDYLTTWSVVSTIADSSVWVIPEFPAGLSMLVISIVITVTVISIERRLNKKQPNSN